METKQLFTRQTAIKIPIQELLQGTYVQENEQNPNYLLTTDERRIYRLNLIATIIQKEVVGTITNILIEDYTGSIIARFFEEHKSLASIQSGDVIRIIGKIRAYNQEKYISPEIIKKVSPLWLKVHAKECTWERKEMKDETPAATELLQSGVLHEKSALNAQNVFVEEELIEEDTQLPFHKIMNLLKELDKGNGVLIEELLEKSPLENTEEIIQLMLKNGDIFQNLPGKVKVL